MKKLFISAFIASLASIGFANALDFTALQQACEFQIEDGEAYKWIEPNCIESEADYNDSTFKKLNVTYHMQPQIANTLCDDIGEATNYNLLKGRLVAVCPNGKVKVAEVASDAKDGDLKTATDSHTQMLEYCKAMRQANGNPTAGAQDRRCSGIKEEDGELLIKLGKHVAGVAYVYKEGDDYVVSYDGE